jgi:hypothetical protein
MVFMIDDRLVARLERCDHNITAVKFIAQASVNRTSRIM